MKVEIDQKSGFCFGVVKAIKKAEEALATSGQLNCLGDIVHNGEEVNRLEKMGLASITHSDLSDLKNQVVLLRAHGEPPSTYETIEKNNLTLIDATCPVVIRLQKRIKKGYEESKKTNGQVVIYGKHGHAEVNGLVGQTNGEAIVISDPSEIDKIDFSRNIYLYSQTTKSISGYAEIKELLEARIAETDTQLFWNDTICRQVSNRENDLRKFARSYDVVLFVSGKKSSNGKYLHSICLQENSQTYFVASKEDLKAEWFSKTGSVGVCGATSTPKWLMEEVAEEACRIDETL